MKRSIPVWMFLLVAVAIAAVAFVVGQVMPGAGMIVVMLCSTLWVAYVARQKVDCARG